MSTIDKARLRELAEKAKQGGYVSESELAYALRDPATVLALLDEIEALQAECERWKNAAHGAHRQLTANRLETEKLAVDWGKAMAECEKLRAAIRRLCNIYVVDDYYDGQLREERLDRAVNRAIDAAPQEPTQ